MNSQKTQDAPSARRDRAPQNFNRGRGHSRRRNSARTAFRDRARADDGAARICSARGSLLKTAA